MILRIFYQENKKEVFFEYYQFRYNVFYIIDKLLEYHYFWYLENKKEKLDFENPTNLTHKEIFITIAIFYANNSM